MASPPGNLENQNVDDLDIKFLVKVLITQEGLARNEVISAAANKVGSKRHRSAVPRPSHRVSSTIVNFDS